MKALVFAGALFICTVLLAGCEQFAAPEGIEVRADTAYFGGMASVSWTGERLRIDMRPPDDGQMQWLFEREFEYSHIALDTGSTRLTEELMAQGGRRVVPGKVVYVRKEE
jgi:hypothetical protein